jgi:hypothetical protein
MTLIEVEGPTGIWEADTSICDDFASMAPVTGAALTMAVNNLWALTGRRLGLTSTTLRPCAKSDPTFISTYNSGYSLPPGLTAGLGNHAMAIVLSDLGGVSSVSCDSCFTPSRSTLHLPFPSTEVTEVNIAGDLIPTSEFAIFNRRLLVWQSPDNSSFPRRQDLTSPLGDPGTWGVTLTHGIPLPSDTPTIVGIYACQLAKRLSNQRCALPSTVQSISRQGISYQMVNPDYLEMGIVGLPDVDQWIVRMNPNRLQQRPVVASPDSIRSTSRHQTFPTPAP